MSRRILLKKATRIEGNATIHVEIDQGRVQHARFMVEDFRGFEKLCQGKAIAHIPHIVSRICGLCCMAHQVASLRAIENALEIAAPEPVRRLRQAAVYGEWIASHALSYFFLTQPDVLGTDEGIFGMIRDHPQMAHTAFAIQKAGSRIAATLGGRAVHPVTMGIGGMAQKPSTADLAAVSALAGNVAERTLDIIRNLDRRVEPERGIALPSDSRVNFLCYDDRSGAPGGLHVYAPDGSGHTHFDAAEFEDHVAEMRVAWSFAKFPYLARLGFPEGIFHVGPLARTFLPHSAVNAPQLADCKVVQEVRPSTDARIECIDIIRLAEIHWAADQIQTLLEGVDPTDIPTDLTDPAESGKGIGVVEAPRGVLIHSYTINRGRIERLKLLVATQFNNPLINLIVKDLAERHLAAEGLTASGQAAIGRCIRLFDPCLTCATH